VDVYLSDVRNQAAAEAFFKQAQKTTGITPIQITTDKEPALYPAIETVFGAATKHRDSKYKNNNWSLVSIKRKIFNYQSLILKSLVS